MGLVVIYSDDGRLLLVTGGRIFSIRVVIPLQTGVVARVLLLDFVFLLICDCVAAYFLGETV